MSDDKQGPYYEGPQAADFTQVSEPFALFETWFADAGRHVLKGVPGRWRLHQVEI